MNPGQRYSLAVALAIAAFLAIAGLALPSREAADTQRRAVEPARPSLEPPAAAPSSGVLPIEEVLAEEKSEDPEAIFFMSRIRETVREGNPAFGRELLRQLKEQHPNSVLIYEAEEILETSR